jgi:hypothetical protein
MELKAKEGKWSVAKPAQHSKNTNHGVSYGQQLLKGSPAVLVEQGW